ncbi:dienelactone hydrolase family protein [Azospirillum picis]|uniref:Carboxymethylenebutenolidase n=1 Tax=Azospirillum picis TaxID=488438 RepID=A0ABU0MV48_9PROT|nr:dienelactone hydrolase family protein [Azospirillum picis]MBP2303459.1 carboxymethylenebutenolidase [Azospirillum picis]MDQ0537352.1 carboxymethylenebutenolidase [Azospirillum picis]
MSEVMIDAADGGRFAAYVVKPAVTPAGGLVVIQEIFGVNAVMRELCDWYASQGFLAVCPDLFWRQKPGVQLTDKTQEEWNQAFALMNGMDQDKAIEDLKAALAWVRVQGDCTGKAGSVGYCLGGRLAFLMAERSDADANVGYYGVGLEGLLGEAGAIKTPVLLHIAENDKFSSPDKRDALLAGVKDNKWVTAKVYPGQDHAFARPGGEHYDQASADEANRLTVEFFRTHLA